MTTDLVAALDIGGTKIAGALVDDTGAVRERFQVPTPAREGGDSVLAAVTAVLDRLVAADGWSAVRGLGIGSAGPVDARSGTVSPVNIPGWRGYPLVSGARRTVGDRLPVALVGDGAAIAAGEHWCGAARGVDNALCMVVSTGVGGGLVLDGRLRTGPSGNAGHIGHICVELDGDTCPCGGRGCVEGIASGTAIARWAGERGLLAPDGGPPTAAHVAAAAGDGEPVATAAFRRAARALAAGIAATATLVELDVVVVGGGVAHAGDVLFAPLTTALGEYAALPYVRGLPVRPALLGADAGLVGAAAAVRRSPGGD
ncbi:ROK family protein [Streptomyces lonarensis]|uniref:ROK family protein n=1 Tax=Streptomyces lonarensis TaxID=700599 RepID=A0A7X6HYI3_9ACTN|nr:ROK family protein [Streptomyces lonarensis]NJQ05621.1 ROK family protein [Streptomyces lonarensis]